MGKYAKTITALITALIGWAILVVNSKPTSITAGEWILLVSGIATALGVYVVPNATRSEF